jgi:hypothetical protein
MRIICSWCRREGQLGLVGEKAPLEDLRETHSICKAHQIQILGRWSGGVHAPGKGGRRVDSTRAMKKVKQKKTLRRKAA